MKNRIGLLCFLIGGVVGLAAGSSGGLYGSQSSAGIQQPEDDLPYLDTYKAPNSGSEQQDAGLSQQGAEQFTKAASSTSNQVLGPNYPPESPIDQFEVGYGGTYYRKDGEGGQEGDVRHHPHGSNHVGITQSGSSFSKPLDSYRQGFSNPFLDGPAGNLNANSVAQLRDLANAADLLRSGPRGPSNARGQNNDQNLVPNHSALGPLLPSASLESGIGVAGPPGGPGAFEAQLKLSELHTKVLTHNLAKLNTLGLHLAQDGVKAQAHHEGAYGPPHHHHHHPHPHPHAAYGVPHGKPHGPPLHPLLGKLQAVDAHLKGKLHDKEYQLEQLEREKQALIHAAGKAALGSIREKEKLLNLYGQLGIAAALDKPGVKAPIEPLKYGPPPPHPGPLHHAEKAAALAHAHGHGYNPLFAPVDVAKVPLSPIKPLDYLPPPVHKAAHHHHHHHPPPPPHGPVHGHGFGGAGHHHYPEDHLGTIVPVYSKSLLAKQLHNILVKEELHAKHHYGGPHSGPGYSNYHGKHELKGVADHAYGGPHHHHHLGPHLDAVVDKVAKSTAHALLGALKGIHPGPHAGAGGYHK